LGSLIRHCQTASHAWVAETTPYPLERKQGRHVYVDNFRRYIEHLNGFDAESLSGWGLVVRAYLPVRGGANLWKVARVPPPNGTGASN
jgi:hypothetical protein